MAQTSRCDAELVAAARDARDLAAFAELVARYQHAAFGVALSVVHDRALAEDATQETFLQAWVSLERLRDPSRVAPWLCGIARNVSRTLLRGRNREVLDDDAEPAPDAATPLHQLMEREADRALSELLARVPNRYRAPMVLHYAGEQSVAQIAQCLALSEPNVKKLLSRGREMLRERAARFGELASACRVPATLAVAIVAAAGARSAAAQTTAGAITTLATTGIVVKKTLIIAAAVVACVLALLGVRALRDDADDVARAATPMPAATPPTPIDTAAPPTVQPRRLAGVVLDDRTGAPVANATVLVTRAAGDLATTVREQQQPPHTAVTDATGRFTFDLAAGRFYVDANARGYASPKSVEVELSSADVERVEVRLAPGGIRVHGTVTDFQGGAVVEAIVTAQRAPGGIPSGRAIAAITGADGRYELWLAAGDYELEATHASYAPASADLSLATASSPEVERDLQLVPASFLEGVVLDRRDGAPVPGAIVLVEGRPTLGAIADEQGRFRLARVAAGTFALGARAPHRTTPSSTIVELDIGETRSDIELWLERAANVSGRVVDPDGRPIAGVHTGLVRWTDQLPYEAQTPTDADGRFTIHGVAPGAYGAVAESPDRPRLVRRNAVEVVADRDITDVELVLATGHVVAGRVVPPRPATIRLARTTGPMLAAVALGGDISEFVNLLAAVVRTRADGTFELANAPAGTYVLVAVADDGTRGELPIAIGPRTTAITIELAASPSARGTVVDDRGRPIPNLALRATSDRHYPEQAHDVTTDAAGRFVLRGFAAGDRVQLSITDERCRREITGDASLAVAPDAPDAKIVASGCDHVVRGVVVDKAGAPVRDAWVHVEGNGDDEFQTPPIVTDASGRFAIRNLHDGPFAIAAYHPAHGRARIETAATNTDHRIALRSDASLTVEVRPAAGPFELRLDGAARRTLRSRGTTSTLTVSNLPAGRYRLEVHAERGMQTTELALDAGATQTLTLELVAWSIVRGTLVDPSGRPLANHVVTPFHAPQDGSPIHHDNILTTNNATTDRDGRFELRRVHPQSTVLVVASPSGTFGGVRLAPLRGGDTQDVGRATVKLAATE